LEKAREEIEKMIEPEKKLFEKARSSYDVNVEIEEVEEAEMEKPKAKISLLGKEEKKRLVRSLLHQ
jgi:hypothetical protein